MFPPWCCFSGGYDRRGGGGGYQDRRRDYGSSSYGGSSGGGGYRDRNRDYRGGSGRVSSLLFIVGRVSSHTWCFADLTRTNGETTVVAFISNLMLCKLSPMYP